MLTKRFILAKNEITSIEEMFGSTMVPKLFSKVDPVVSHLLLNFSVIAGILLKSQGVNFFSCRDTKKIDILFGSDYKRENLISQAADVNSILVRWNERMFVIMLSCAELKMKRMSVNYSFVENFTCIQMRMRNFVYA